MGNYCILLYMIGLFVLGVRWVYLSSKLLAYIRTNLPEKAKEIGYAQPHSLKFRRLVFHKNDIDDPSYLQLRAKCQRAETWLTLTILSFFLIFVALEVISNVS